MRVMMESSVLTATSRTQPEREPARSMTYQRSWRCLPCGSSAGCRVAGCGWWRCVLVLVEADAAAEIACALGVRRVSRRRDRKKVRALAACWRGAGLLVMVWSDVLLGVLLTDRVWVDLVRGGVGLGLVVGGVLSVSWCDD